MVAWISFQRPGRRGLEGVGEHERSMVASASGTSEFALRTVSIRGPHASLAPGGDCGAVSQSIAESRRCPCAMAKA